MAKTIKFNLIMNNNPIRTIEDLQNNFFIEDILNYFKNGLLEKWLWVREFYEYHNEISKIDHSLDNFAIITQLIKLFDIETNEDKIKTDIEILTYRDTERERNAIHERNAFSKTEILKEYKREYLNLIHRISSADRNMTSLKADAAELARNYDFLFLLDNRRLFFLLEKENPKAIFAILMQVSLRDFWLNSAEISHNLNTKILPNVKEILGNHVKVVAKDTRAMWDQIERKEVKLMILSVKKDTFVKNAGHFAEKLSYADINGKFPLFDGLEYQCNNSTYELLYMEV